MRRAGQGKGCSLVVHFIPASYGQSVSTLVLRRHWAHLLQLLCHTLLTYRCKFNPPLSALGAVSENYYYYYRERNPMRQCVKLECRE